MHTTEEIYTIIRSKNAFDDAYYLASNPDVAASGIDPLTHYITTGSREGRQPTPFFAPLLYLAENPDVAAAEVEPFFHFLVQGSQEGRRVPTPAAPAAAVPIPEQVPPTHEPPVAARFDAVYYLAKYEDVKAAGLDPERHYDESGEAEGRRPNAFFDPRYYAQVNPDVAAAGIGLFRHFQSTGWREGRKPINPAANWRSFKSDKNILFIGHDAIQAGAQTVLLETLRWFTQHTDLNVTLLLCDVGQLIGDYAEFADVYVFHNYTFAVDDRIAPLLGMKWEFIYANTVRSGLVAQQFLAAAKHKAPLIAHLHELEKVLSAFGEELAALVATADRFIVVNDRIAEDLAARHKVPRAAITVEHPFIRSRLDGASDRQGAMAARAAARQALGLGAATLVVAACGTAYERKGIDIFVETGLAYLGNRPGDDVAFVWIGDGADLEACRQRVQQAGAGRHFVFPGHRADASRLVACADIFFLSSREDPFPLVCLEAAQYGIPILHFDVGTGIAAFVRATDPVAPAGIALPAFSARAAAIAIDVLRMNPAHRTAFGDHARTRLFTVYEAEAKLAGLYQILLRFGFLRPSVTVIVPNYNHERYLDARLASILSQTIKSIEVVVLDDASTDTSAAVIAPYLADARVSFHPNIANSGSPFAQWAKGLGLATSDIIWIAESDDVADLDFCRNLIGAFADPMVSIATGKSLIIDANGTVVPGALEPYYDGAEIDLFKGSWTRDGIEFIRSHFGVKCTLVNASAMLLRKSRLAASMEGVGRFRMCGDWLVYLRMLIDGKIAFSESALSYFRRHDKSAVHVVEGTPVYFRERAEIAAWVAEHGHLTRAALRRVVHELRLEWDRFAWKNPDGIFEEHIDAPALERHACRRRGTIGLYVHGMLFSKGGIERLAADLAGTLVRAGYEVIVYCADRAVRKPVYPLFQAVRVVGIDIEATDGVNRLADRLRRDGVTVFVPMLSEWLFETAVEAGARAGVAVLVSEHNDPWKIEELWWSQAQRARTFAKADRIHLLVPRYQRSLPEPLRDRAVVIPNGVDLGDLPAPATCLAKRIVCVARFAPQKRLDLLVDAFAIVARARVDWTLTILGDGHIRDAIETQVATLGLGARIAMPGTSEAVEAVLADSAFFVLPSAFEGFPIVVLEALRAGLPCIAFEQAVGEGALRHEVNGLLVRPFSAEALAQAMLRLIDDESLRVRYGQAARAGIASYALDAVMARWVDLIDGLVEDAR